MKRSYFLLPLLALASLAVGQQTPPPPQPGQPAQRQFPQPAVPAPSINMGGGGFYGGGYGAGTTVAGSAMSGMASVISAQGDRALATSAAAVNMTQAESQELQNRQQATDTYFQMRQSNKAYTDMERGPSATKEQVERFARQGAPRPLSGTQVDPITGKVAWPTLLADDQFAKERIEIDRLAAKQATYGGLAFPDQTVARNTIQAMFSRLKTQIREVPTQVYTSSRTFLESLLYAMTKSSHLG